MKGKDGQNIKALLPMHEPSDSVWEKIEAKLNTEEAGNTHDETSELTKSLPVYTPSENVWNEIEHKLNAAKMRSRLPEYAPKETLWSELDANIENPKTPKSKRLVVLRWAAVLIIVIGSALILRNVINEKSKLEYHVEWEDAHGPAASNTERSSFGSDGIEGNELIEQLCQRSQATCDTPEFKELETELVELETARAEIKAQINPYSDNSKLERMLVHIELEHSKIINEMTQKLL